MNRKGIREIGAELERLVFCHPTFSTSWRNVLMPLITSQRREFLAINQLLDEFKTRNAHTGVRARAHPSSWHEFTCLKRTSLFAVQRCHVFLPFAIRSVSCHQKGKRKSERPTISQDKCLARGRDRSKKNQTPYLLYPVKEETTVDLVSCACSDKILTRSHIIQNWNGVNASS